MTIALADFDATSRFGTAGSMRLHYHEAGHCDAGTAVVVMLHGGGPTRSAAAPRCGSPWTTRAGQAGWC